MTDASPSASSGATESPDAPLVVGVIDSGVHAGHPHIGRVTEGAGFDPAGVDAVDTIDRLGHGTAVAAAIQQVAPEAVICPLKVFDRTDDASVDTLVAALEWAVARALPLVNLSLGLTEWTSAARLTRVVDRARAAGTVIVAAARRGGVDLLPGALEGVVRVELDWEVARGRFTMAGPADAPSFRTSGFPRSIPGVDPARNLRGLSFAVAGITGAVARLMIDTGIRGVAPVVDALARRATR